MGPGTAFLEILGTWRSEDLQRRIEAMDAHPEIPLILAVSRRLAGEKKSAVPDHPRVVGFAEVLSPKRIGEAFERAGVTLPA